MTHHHVDPLFHRFHNVYISLYKSLHLIQVPATLQQGLIDLPHPTFAPPVHRIYAVWRGGDLAFYSRAQDSRVIIHAASQKVHQTKSRISRSRTILQAEPGKGVKAPYRHT